MDPDSEPPLLPAFGRNKRFVFIFLLTASGFLFVAASGGGVEPLARGAGWLVGFFAGWPGLLLAMAAGLAGAGHFTVLNYALFALDSEEIQDLARSRPRSARLLRRLRRRLDRTWFTLLAGSVFFNLALALAFCGAVMKLAAPAPGAEAWGWFFLGGAGGVAVVLVFGEAAPGLLAARRLKSMVPFAARCVQVWSVVFYPITCFPLWALRLAGKLRGVDLKERYGNLEVEKRLLTLIGVGQADVSLEEGEREMIDHALEFGQTRVRDIMTPRKDIVAFDTKCSQEEALAFMRRVPRSRVLVHNGSLDHVVGVLHTKQILLNPRKDYHELAHEPLFVDENMDLIELLAVMRSRRTQLVVVLDEYGATDGVASFDDLLEAIVGELPEEAEASPESVLE